MREEAARQVLLIQALEEADPEGRLLSPAERVRATEVARGGGAREPVALVARRAEYLVSQLARRLPWIDSALAATSFPHAAAWMGTQPAACVASISVRTPAWPAIRATSATG